MTLQSKQSRFVKEFSEFLIWVYSQGYEVTYGEFYRTEEQAALNAKKGVGIKNSLHTVRLAADINLFKNGKWLTSTEDHRPLGEKWESMGEDHRWGGRFGDGNHYSIEHEGRR